MQAPTSVRRRPSAAPDPEEPFDPVRPFSRAQARAAGITLRALLSPAYHKVIYDRYVLATVPITLELRAEAALRVSPDGSAVSHHTAARLWGGVVPETSEVHVTVPPETVRAVRLGLRSHLATKDTATTTRRGRLTTTAEQTFLDLAATGLDLVDLVVLGDSLVKAGRTTAEKLVLAAASWTGRGAKRARRAAGWVRPHVDSAMETRLRMLLVLAGLPEPTINLIMRHPDGTWKWRLDLCYPALKVVVEYDGRQHSEDSRQWGKDLKRREELNALGWRIIVVTSDDLNHQPAQVLERVRAAMLARGATGLRRAFRTEWVRHFPRAL